LENRDGLWTFEGDKYTGYLYEVDGDFVVGEVEILAGEEVARPRTWSGAQCLEIAEFDPPEPLSWDGSHFSGTGMFFSEESGRLAIEQEYVAGAGTRVVRAWHDNGVPNWDCDMQIRRTWRDSGLLWMFEDSSVEFELGLSEEGRMRYVDCGQELGPSEWAKVSSFIGPSDITHFYGAGMTDGVVSSLSGWGERWEDVEELFLKGTAITLDGLTAILESAKSLSQLFLRNNEKLETEGLDALAEQHPQCLFRPE
jgi:hypothetical protein